MSIKNNMIDKNKLPAMSVSIVEDYFQKIDKVSFEGTFLLVQFYISKLLCSNRVRIVNERNKIDTFPNLYCLTISRSGSNKDKHRTMMDKLCQFFYKDLHDMEAVFVRQSKYRLENEAEKQGLKNGKIETYVKENMPRSLYSNISSTSTPEGLASVHEALNEARFGSITWLDQEISDTMVRYRSGSSLDELITMIKESYDNGSFKPKIIKGSKVVRAAGPIPYLMWAHGALDLEHRQSLFEKFFNLGYGRRTIIYFNQEEQEDNRSIEKIQSDLDEANKCEFSIIEFLKEIYLRTKPDAKFTHNENGIFTIDKEAEIAYLEYKKLCQNRSVNMSRFTSGLIRDEMRNRSWKMLKLACVFTVQESINNIITKERIEQAIYFVEYYSKYLSDLMGLDNESSIAEHILNTLEVEGRTNKTKFYKKTYFPKYNGGQAKTLAENIEIADEIAMMQGKTIIEHKLGKKYFEYELVDLPTSDQELALLAYVRENCQNKRIGIVELNEKFGSVSKYILDKHKVKADSEGAYFIK